MNALMHLQSLEGRMDAIYLWFAGNGEVTFGAILAEISFEIQFTFWLIIWINLGIL